MKLDPKSSMALMIDLQEKLVPAMSDPVRLIERSVLFLRGLQICQIPVMVTRQYPKGLGDTVLPIRNILFPEQITFEATKPTESVLKSGKAEDPDREKKNSSGPVILGNFDCPDQVLELKQDRSAVDVYDKISFSCLDEPGLRSAVDRPEIRNIFVLGIEAHICVLQTIEDLLGLGKRVYYISDCMDSRVPLEKTVAEKRLIQAGAIPATSEMVLFELIRCAGSEQFKKISKLVTGR